MDGLQVTEMNVPEGFKQTEVGVIPEDWEVHPIGEAYEIKNNLRLPISKKIRENMEGVYPYYGPTNIQGYINEYRVEGEHVLIGEDGDHFFKWRNMPMTLLVNGKFNVNNHAHIVKGADDSTRWFHYYFSHRDITKHLSRQGAGRYKLNKKSLEEILCVLPTRAEQTAIAAALSDMDALIEGMEKLLEKKRRIKQGAMQELLRPKEGWICRPVKSFTDATAGGTPNTEVDKYWDGDIRWMNSGELHLKRIYEVEGRITESGLKNSSTRLLPKYCVLIGLAGQGKTRGTVAINQIELCTNQSIAAIFPNDSFIPDYLYYNLDLRYIELRKLSTGDGGRGGLNLTLIRAIEVPFPPTIDEQKKIVQILNDMDTEIVQLETQLTKYRQLKTGMMQELLTGKKRLV